MNELALFAGAGGGILASKLLGWRTICAVECANYPASVLLQRQNEGILPAFPIWDDVRTFDGRPWKGVVDVVSGGFPCQDISSAGKGAGIDGERSGLWSEFARIIREVQPRYVFIENSPMLRTRGLGRVLKDLAEAGYNAAWGVLSAKDCGANHERKRMWIVGYSNLSSKPISTINDETQRMQRANEDVANTNGGGRKSTNNKREKQFSRENAWRLDGEESTNTDSTQRQGGRLSSRGESQHSHASVGSWWEDTSPLNGMDDGVAYRMDRLKAIGNGQVPIVAATAFKQLMRVLEDNERRI